jgi:two-component system, chemotaxis family, CheB/CheR fusion protein
MARRQAGATQPKRQLFWVYSGHKAKRKRRRSAATRRWKLNSTPSCFGSQTTAPQEELQSINEELQTVNSELKMNLDAISRANGDLQNLLAATDFGTVFLNSDLRIKRFTERTADIFGITQSDEGRPITDFSHQLEYDELIQDIRKVPVAAANSNRTQHRINCRAGAVLTRAHAEP